MSARRLFMLSRRSVMAGALSAAAWPLARAQAFPSRPIRIVLGTVPGSGPDVATRNLAAQLTDVLKQQVIVDNKPGANGMLAAQEVARAPRDGYTLFNANIGNMLNDLLRPDNTVRLGQELIPVSDLTAGSLILLVHPEVPARDLKELIELARSRPGALNYGSGGPGSMTQITGERIKLAGRFDMTEVPYKSIGADLVDLMGGQLQVGFSVWSVVGPHVKAGKVRAIAVAGARRLPGAPDMPTLSEAGLPGLLATGWNGIFAPAGTPDEVVHTLQRAIAAAIARPEFQQYVQRDGSESGGRTPEEFAAFLRNERSQYERVIREARVKLQ